MVTHEFKTPLGATGGSDTFSSVSILTGEAQGDAEYNQSIQDQIDLVARKIESADGLVMRYQSTSGNWEPVSYNQTQNNWQATQENISDHYGKPLVLLADWVEDTQPNILNSGFSEAAADSLFASMVQLDLENGGEVGNGNIIYDENGELNRSLGAVFNSPLHFIGFGLGAVVNTEIVQRLGTFFPEVGATGVGVSDIHVTTIDPYQEIFPEDDPEPSIETWANVNYADNYYQTIDLAGSQELATADLNLNLSEFANIDQDSPHKQALTWFAGTSNLSESQDIVRRLGDLPDINNPQSTWYTPDHADVDFEHGDENAPWEGIGTGWFYSVLGGGDDLRPYFLEGNKLSKAEIEANDGLKKYLHGKRTSVSKDNNSVDGTPGDYAVPTLFNGNFDVIAEHIDSQTIPGWSSNRQNSLADVTNILGATAYSNSHNYALKLDHQTSTATHDLFMIPEWGNLRFDLHAPKATGILNVKLETTTGEEEEVTINLEEAEFIIDGTNRTNLDEIKGFYSDNKNKLGFARRGFETFQLNLQLEDSQLLKFRGQPANLTFSLEGEGDVYIDNVFFKSDYLKLGNPTDARWNPNNETDRNNLLLEKPQYTVSYNAESKHANWVGWKVDSTWVQGPELTRPEFIADEDLPNDFTRYDGNIFTGLGMNRGHLAPDRDRRRHPKDQLATYLTTNLIAQSMDNNRIFPNSQYQNDASAWFNIEETIAERASDGEELYIFAGAFGNNPNLQAKTRAPELYNESINGVLINKGNTKPSNLSTQKGTINIPEWTWKVIIPENSVSLTQEPVAYLTPNRAEPFLYWWNEPETEGVDPSLVSPVEGYPHPLNQFLGNRSNITSREQWRDPETWKMTVPEFQKILDTRTDIPNFNFIALILDDDIEF